MHISVIVTVTEYQVKEQNVSVSLLLLVSNSMETFYFVLVYLSSNNLHEPAH